MNKFFTFLLALALLLAPGAFAGAGAEESDSALGDWYDSLNGVPLRFTVNGDGSYVSALPTVFCDPATGIWEYRRSFLYLDGNVNSPMNLVNEKLLLWADNGLVFTREIPPAYTPSGTEKTADLDWYTGYWKSAWEETSGTAVPASAVSGSTDIYIEGTRTALGGPLFGDVFQDFSFENGAMNTLLEDGRSVTLAFQQDGMLRMTLTDPDGADTVLYLSQAYSSALDPDA